MLKKLLVNPLIGLPLLKIELDAADYKKAIYLVKAETREELSEHLHVLLKQVMNNAYGGNTKILSYLQNAIPDIVTELKNGVENNCMENIV